jgi:hypothetical protein
MPIFHWIVTNVQWIMQNVHRITAHHNLEEHRRGNLFTSRSWSTNMALSRCVKLFSWHVQVSWSFCILFLKHGHSQNLVIRNHT